MYEQAWASRFEKYKKRAEVAEAAMDFQDLARSTKRKSAPAVNVKPLKFPVVCMNTKAVKAWIEKKKAPLGTVTVRGLSKF